VVWMSDLGRGCGRLLACMEGYWCVNVWLEVKIMNGIGFKAKDKGLQVLGYHLLEFASTIY
jgi:hypothetical protein